MLEMQYAQFNWSKEQKHFRNQGNSFTSTTTKYQQNSAPPKKSAKAKKG